MCFVLYPAHKGGPRGWRTVTRSSVSEGGPRGWRADHAALYPMVMARFPSSTRKSTVTKSSSVACAAASEGEERATNGRGGE